MLLPPQKHNGEICGIIPHHSPFTKNNILLKGDNNYMNEILKQHKNTITTLEIAEMMEIRHSDILAKLDGTNKIKGIIPILNERKIPSVDYFIKSSYVDAKGEERPCYLVTKLGCDF